MNRAQRIYPPVLPGASVEMDAFLVSLAYLRGTPKAVHHK